MHLLYDGAIYDKRFRNVTVADLCPVTCGRCDSAPPAPTAAECRVCVLVSDARTVVATNYEFCTEDVPWIHGHAGDPSITVLLTVHTNCLQLLCGPAGPNGPPRGMPAPRSGAGLTMNFAVGRRWEGGPSMVGAVPLGHDRLGELCAGGRGSHQCADGRPSRRELLHMLAHTLPGVTAEQGVVDTRPQSVVIVAATAGASSSFAGWQTLAVGEQLVVDKENGTVWRRCITAACEFAKHSKSPTGSGSGGGSGGGGGS